MRLIDADNLSKNIAKWCMGGDPQETETVKHDEILLSVVDEIKNQPTAYDVEKVKEQITSLNGYALYPITFNCILEIVRKGGVEKMAELKKCPFCGGEAEVYEGESERNIYDSHTFGYVDTEYYTVYGVGCTACNSIMAEFSSEEEAINAWNNRATEAEIREKAISELLEKTEKNTADFIGTNGYLTGADFRRILHETAEQLKEE